MHFIVMTVSAEPQEWRFFIGMDDAKLPIWGEPAKAIQFSTFQQACRIARRVGGAQICASLTRHQEVIQ